MLGFWQLFLRRVTTNRGRRRRPLDLLPPVNSDGGRLRITTPTYASYHDLTELDRLSEPLRS